MRVSLESGDLSLENNKVQQNQVLEMEMGESERLEIPYRINFLQYTQAVFECRGNEGGSSS